jgi:DNA-binding NtrC family response regulator
MPSRFHILIVEDEPLVAECLQEMLVSEYHVSSANTVREALAFLRTSHVHVALVDSVLPDGHGDEIAAYAEAYGTAVIEMSGYPQVMADLERSDRPHLLKPFATDVLFSTIGKALQLPKKGRTELSWWLAEQDR